MNAYAKLGRASDIKRVYLELEAALSEGLDAESAQETSDLKDQLLRLLAQESHMDSGAA